MVNWIRERVNWVNRIRSTNVRDRAIGAAPPPKKKILIGS